MVKIDSVAHLLNHKSCLPISGLAGPLKAFTYLSVTAVSKAECFSTMRNIGGGAMEFIARILVRTPFPMFHFSASKINCTFIRCKPREF